MQNKSRFFSFLLESPLFLICFAVVPGALVFSRIAHVALPFQITTRMILANVICLLFCICGRFVYYLVRFPNKIRYGVERSGSSSGVVVARSAAEMRNELEKNGYSFAGTGTYAEKRDLGYLGTVAVYGGLLVVACIGICDNLTQFSGTTIHGLGVPAALSNHKIYYPLIKGALASVDDLPLLGISGQTFPNRDYPKGCTDIVLLSKDKRPLLKERLVAMGEPVSYGGFNIYLAKLLVDASLTISLKGGKEKHLFEDAVKLSPLWKNEGTYNYYGEFSSPEADEGELFYDSSRNNFRIVLHQNGRTIIDTVYEFQQYREKTAGEYILKIAGIGRWSEIHVVHQRHMTAIIIGSLIALAGLIVRIVFRPKRVWLEETAEGCRVWGLKTL